MNNALKSAYENVLMPLWRRPRRIQVAALCTRGEGQDQEVLLVTSRDTGRWVLPKGWPMDGKDAASAALQEAWEEAGVQQANMSEQPMGTYAYDKRLDGGLEIPVDVAVFRAEVKKIVDHFPEAKERTRKWMSPNEAADLVHEPELKTLLRDFSQAA